MMDRSELENLDREGLLAEAHRHGVKRPEVMTRYELTDEILRLTTPNPVERKQVRGWLGVARDLVASVVDKGLNLPDAAAVIRGDVRFDPLTSLHRPVATVTLAEIYGAQGHYVRAMQMLDEVLDKEPEHDVARRLRQRLELMRDRRGAVDATREAMLAPDPLAVGADGVLAAAEANAFDDEVSEDLDSATLPPEPDYSFRDEPTKDFSEPPPPRASVPPEPPEPEEAPPAPHDDDQDEQGTSVTLPPLHAEEAQATTSPSPGEDDDGTAATLPPVDVDESQAVPSALTQSDDDTSDDLDDLTDDEDGNSATIPPLSMESGPRTYDDEDGDPATIPPEDDPKTLPPAAQVVSQEASPFEGLSSPVRRVAASDDGWEPLPQTEEAPSIIDAPPAPAIEEPVAAPPPTFSDDAVVVFRASDGTASLYFELASTPERDAVVRVVELRPRPSFAERIERELPVTAKSGLVTIGELEGGSIVRAAIGVREGDLFRALAVAAEVKASVNGPEIVWAPRAKESYAAVARNASLVLPLGNA